MVYKIGQICNVINGRAYLMPELLDVGKYRILRVGNFFNSDKWYYSDLELPDDKYCYEGDLLFAWSCSFGPKIWHGEKTIFHYHIWKLVEDKALVCKRWLYYWLVNAVSLLTAGNHGSVMMHMTKGEMEDMSISLPPLSVQQRIAAVLGALDDKIELNRKMNANLEAQAQALFKSWFIDFEPWGGQMPAGWKKGTLGEICDCVLGGTPNRNKSEYWNGEISWINSGKVNEFRIVEPSERITQLGLNKSAAKLLPAKTVVLAITGATLGQISILEIPAAANQSVIGVVQNSVLPYEFLYPFLCNKIDDLIARQTGGAQQHINKNDVESVELSLPDSITMKRYLGRVSAMFATIANNCFESRQLAALRDALLPKLMSGELSVEEVA